MLSTYVAQQRVVAASRHMTRTGPRSLGARYDWQALSDIRPIAAGEPRPCQSPARTRACCASAVSSQPRPSSSAMKRRWFASNGSRRCGRGSMTERVRTIALAAAARSPSLTDAAAAGVSCAWRRPSASAHRRSARRACRAGRSTAAPRTRRPARARRIAPPRRPARRRRPRRPRRARAAVAPARPARRPPGAPRRRPARPLRAHRA